MTMETLAAHSRIHLPLILRTCALAVLFVLQFEILEVALRGYYDETNLRQSVWMPIQGGSSYFFSFLPIFLVVFLLVTNTRTKSHAKRFIESASPHAWPGFAAAQIIALLHRFMTRAEPNQLTLSDGEDGETCARKRRTESFG